MTPKKGFVKHGRMSQMVDFITDPEKTYLTPEVNSAVSSF